MTVKKVKCSVTVIRRRPLVVTGTASENDIRKAVEQAGFEFKGVK